MTAHDGYLPVSQEDELSVAPANIATPWWVVPNAQTVYFITKNAGLLLVICAEFAFASMNLSVRLLETMDPPTPTLELITLRMVITAGCCTIYTTANRIPDSFLGPKDVRGLLVIRALFGFCGIFGMYYALNYITLADAVVITFVGPFVIALAGHLILGESYTRKEALAGACGLLGVILIARPAFLFGGTVEGDGGANITSFERLRAVGSVLVGVCGGTGTFITMRVIGTRAHPMHIVTFFSIFCVIVGSIGIAMTRESVVFVMTWRWITLLLIIGLFSVAGQFMLTLALRYETATRSALGSFCHLFFAAILEFVVLGTVPSPLSVAGAGIIIAAQVYAILSKQNLPDQPSGAASPIHSDDIEERLLGSDRADASQNVEIPLRHLDTREEC